MTIAWHIDPDPLEWDRALADIGGHPLQSRAWGELRRHLDGIPDTRLLAVDGSTPHWMARVEHRKLPGGMMAGWVPRGPTAINSALVRSWPDGLEASLTKLGFSLLIAEPQIRHPQHVPARPSPRQTIWVDLTAGEDAIFARADKKWRNSVRRAEKDSIDIRQAAGAADIAQACGLIRDVSTRKGFRLPFSEAHLTGMIERANAHVGTALTLAGRNGAAYAVAFTVRCGNTIHYLAGGASRDQKALGASEALHWHIMRKAAASGATRYDLEGIDTVRNPGTAAFKQKLGGGVVLLHPRIYMPVSKAGRILAASDRAMRWLRG